MPPDNKLVFSSTSGTTTTARPKSDDDGSFNFFLESVADQRKKLQFIPGAIMMKDSEGNTVVKDGGLKLDDQVRNSKTSNISNMSQRLLVFTQPFYMIDHKYYKQIRQKGSLFSWLRESRVWLVIAVGAVHAI